MLVVFLLTFIILLPRLQAQPKVVVKQTQPKMEGKVAIEVMSQAYLKCWSPEVQAKIDRDIELNRKSDAVCHLPDVNEGTEVKVDQISHLFLFGGNIFLFGDLKNKEKNERYKDTFGSLFNSATVPFYWKTLEPVKGKPRYGEDSPYEYRRPATDQIGRAHV